MNTIAKNTAELIGKTPEEYGQLIIKLWLTYCKTKARQEGELQLLLINKPLNNWFLEELRALEYQFKNDAKSYLDTSSPKDLYNMWKTEILHIFTLHSYPLINVIRDTDVSKWNPQLN